MSFSYRWPVLTALLFATGSPAASESPWVWTVDAATVHQGNVDFEQEDGAFSFDRWYLSAGVDYLWDRRTSLGFAMGGGRSNYDFDLPSGTEPWDEIEDLRFSLAARFPINDRATALIRPSYRINREQGASTGASGTYGLLAGVSWRLNDRLTIGPGLAVIEQLEESANVFPIVLIDWQINERWSLSTGRGVAASEGPGLTLARTLNDDWSLKLSARYEDIDFRLNDSGAAPGGVGRDRAVPLFLAADWNPNPGLSLSLFAGAEFAGALILDDADGRRVSRADYETAYLLGATLRVRLRR